MCRVGNALEKGGERDVPPGLRRRRRRLPPELFGGLEDGGEILLVVPEQEAQQGNAQGVQIGGRTEIREDPIPGAGKLRAEREAEAAKAALFELDEVAREHRLVRADALRASP